MDIQARRYLVHALVRMSGGRVLVGDIAACEGVLYKELAGRPSAYLSRMGTAQNAARHERAEASLRPAWPAWKLFVDPALFEETTLALIKAISVIGTQASALDLAATIMKRLWFELDAAGNPTQLLHNLPALVSHVRSLSGPTCDPVWALCVSFEGLLLTETVAFRGLFLWQRLCLPRWRAVWRQQLQDAYCWQGQPTLEQSDAFIQAEKIAFATSPTFQVYGAALTALRQDIGGKLARLVEAATEDEKEEVMIDSMDICNSHV